MKKILILFTIILFSLNSNAQGEVVLAITQKVITGQAKKMTISSIIKEIKEQVFEVVDKFENSSINIIGQAEQSVRYQILLLDEIYKDNLNLTFESLSDAEEKIFKDLLSTIDYFTYSLENELFSEINETIDDIGNHLSNLPIIKKSAKPFITSYKAPLVIKNYSSGFSTIIFHGTLLTHHMNKVLLGDKEYKLKAETNNKARVDIPVEDLLKHSQTISNNNIEIEVKVYRKSGRRSVIPTRYYPVIKLYDNIIGKIQIHYTTNEINKQKIKREKRYRLYIPGSRGRVRALSFPVNSTKGYWIDEHSISVKQVHMSEGCNQGQQTTTITNVKPTGFSVLMRGKTDNQLERSSCSYTVNVSYIEYKDIRKDVTKESEIKDLQFSKDCVFELAKNTTAISYIKIILNDGSEVILDRQKIYGNLIDYSYNSTSKVAIIRLIK